MPRKFEIIRHVENCPAQLFLLKNNSIF